jgi:hypothetical protein
MIHIQPLMDLIDTVGRVIDDTHTHGRWERGEKSSSGRRPNKKKGGGGDQSSSQRTSFRSPLLPIRRDGKWEKNIRIKTALPGSVCALHYSVLLFRNRSATEATRARLIRTYRRQLDAFNSPRYHFPQPAPPMSSFGPFRCSGHQLIEL